MALYINASLRDGRPSLVNIEQLVSISYSRDSITYVPVYGFIQGGYPPSLASGKQEYMDIIYKEIMEFIANNTSGIYDAHKRLKELSKI